MNDFDNVSVVVISYNSAKTITQTLDSIYNQDYPSLELIISDDASIDSTINISSSWVKKHRTRFKNVVIITAERNSGVPGNCNRGVKYASGPWIKSIAADDVLLPNCISIFMLYAKQHINVQCIFSKYQLFKTENNQIVFGDYRPTSKFVIDFYKAPLYSYLLSGMNITPSLFYKKSLIERLGGFDERYKLFEDTPMVVKIIQSGVHIHYIDEPTVLYRIGESSITKHDKNAKNFYKISFVECLLKYKRENIYKLISWRKLRFWLKEFSFLSQYYFTKYILRNKKNTVTQVIYYLYKGLNPYNLYQALEVKLKDSKFYRKHQKEDG